VRALSQMMRTVARVRRDDRAVEVDAEELVPSGKASLVPVPMAPKRYRPGCSAVTEAVRCNQAQPAWTARCVRPRRQDENVFLRFGTEVTVLSRGSAHEGEGL